MYFKDRNDTNIDSEFKNNSNNNLLHLFSLLNKYKMIIIGVVLVILLIILMCFLFMNRKVTNYLILNGEENITLYQGTNYIEPGYNAYNSKDEDLNSKVIIRSTLDINNIGEYEITYTVGDITKTRIITVIEKPKEYTYIYLKTVNNDINVYLKVNEEYIEPGYQVFSSTGINLTDQVKVTGDVDISKKGTYKLVYSVIDSNNVTITATRTVIVMDSEISLSLSNDEYTNKDINIEVKIMDNYFDYMILPDNTKITDSTYSYKVKENGTYKFIVYNKRGNKKESSIKVTNIDRTPPTGSCSGNYKDGKSTIIINSNDNIGISTYEINGSKYTNNIITINNELKTVDISIYDKAGNTKNISCNLTDKNEIKVPEEPIISDKNITFTYKYVSEEDYMPYALFTPSTVNNNQDIPLIVWLHGGSEFNAKENIFKQYGLLKVLNNWKLDGFNAYVLCPHVAGKFFTSGVWVKEITTNNLFNLIDKFVKENNVDTNKIILAGHSQGGRGTLYAAYQRPEFFSALIVLSSADPTIDITTLKHIPAKGYSEGYNYMKTKFANTFGKENYTEFKTTHGNIPNMAFNQDENNDNKSDVIEWALRQSK